MKKVAVHINFAHTYVDKPFGEEQLKSIALTKDLIKKLDHEGQTYMTSVLLDDQHPTFSEIYPDRFVKKIHASGIALDSLWFESKFFKTAEKVCNAIASDKIYSGYFGDPQPHKTILLKNDQGGVLV